MVDLVRLEPGAIVITSGPNPAAIRFDPPSRRLESAGEGATDAARTVLNPPHLGHPQLEAAAGVLGFALSPFAAAYGAIRASQQRLPPDKLTETEQELAAAMRSYSGSEVLRQKVGESARQKTRRLLVCAESNSAPAASRAPVSAQLEVAVEQLYLKAANASQTQFALHIAARARLVRAADGQLLLDRPYQYQSGPAFFIDWTRPGGLGPVAQTGFQTIAEHIAEDVFHSASAPPIRIGPGHKHSQAATGFKPAAWAWHIPSPRHGERLHTRSRPLANLTAHRPKALVKTARWGHARFPTAAARHSAAKEEAVFQLASLSAEDAASLEAHSGGTNQSLLIRPPASESKAGPPTESQTDWTFDNLNNDRNSVVQVVSCLAALPIGLWEHTLGAVGQHSRDRNDKLATDLNAIAAQGHLERALADAVAQSLESQVGGPIQRTEAPLRFALPTLAPVGETGATTRKLSDRKTALEIQVLSTKLVGKHRYSRSQALTVMIQATLVRASDGQELYSCPIYYQSTSRKLSDWAASDAKQLHQELNACSREAAQAVAKELLTRQ